MILVTIAKAAAMPFAPSRTALYKQLRTAEEKQTPRPKYFVDDKGKIKIDVEHPDWIAYLDTLREKSGGAKQSSTAPKVTTQKRKTKKKTATESGADIADELLQGEKFELLIARSKIALLEEQILKNDGVRYLNEKKKIALKKEAGEIFDAKFAAFLYLGYIEKLNIELLSLCKKIEPMIDNLVKKGDTQGVIALFNRHFENILTEIKQAQKKDVEEWESEIP